MHEVVHTQVLDPVIIVIMPSAETKELLFELAGTVCVVSVVCESECVTGKDIQIDELQNDCRRYKPGQALNSHSKHKNKIQFH